MQGIWVEKPGDTTVLQHVSLPTARAGAEELLIRIEAAGLNAIDLRQRRGKTQSPWPYIAGHEGCGTIVAQGKHVNGFTRGQRVAFCQVLGAFATYIAVPAARACPLPAGLSTAQGAAAMMQGLLAHALTHDVCPPQPGQWYLLTSAAGGVASLLAQYIKSAGGHTLGVTSTAAKAQKLSQRPEWDRIIVAQDNTSLLAALDQTSIAKNFHALFDGWGGPDLPQRLSRLQPRGHAILYGFNAGRIPPETTETLRKGPSWSLTVPRLFDYVATAKALKQRANALFEAIQQGSLRLYIEHELPLADIARAHRLLEDRLPCGKIILRPKHAGHAPVERETAERLSPAEQAPAEHAPSDHAAQATPSPSASANPEPAASESTPPEHALTERLPSAEQTPPDHATQATPSPSASAPERTLTERSSPAEHAPPDHATQAMPAPSASADPEPAASESAAPEHTLTERSSPAEQAPTRHAPPDHATQATPTPSASANPEPAASENASHPPSKR